MDGGQFDDLTRALARGRSRRALVRGLAGALAVGLTGARTVEDATAQRGARKANGVACTRATDCASLKCVDGVCCNAACTGQCESCASGACMPVAGNPVGNRPTCPGSGPCKATCDGVTRTRCAAFPGGDVGCGAATCSGGWLTTSACGGNGACVPTTTSCAPYGCDPSGAACASGCTSHDQCTGSSYCAAGVCVGDQALGAACADHAACQSGVCANGVCCNEACIGECRACGADGFCGPADDNTTCAGGRCCEGSCIDVSTDVEHCGACHTACLGDVCQAAVCAGGVCGTTPLPDGIPCDDGLACTSPDACRGGVCTGPATECPPPAACHDPGACDSGTGDCVYPVWENGAECDDGDACTAGDACQGGSCVGAPIDCDDGLSCTDDTCDPATGCSNALQFGFCVIDDSCVAADTRNPATPCQICNPAASQSAWTDLPFGAACDDATLCNGREACDGAGACQPGIPVSCPPPDACQDDGVCNPATGDCTYAPKAAESVCRAATEPCQADAVCDGTNPACPPNEIAVGRDCDDGDPCTTGDACQADGTCAGTSAACEDGLACTANFCDPATGCIHVLQLDDCLIEGACYAAGERNPENTCLSCEPTEQRRQWTMLVDTPCDGPCLTGGTCQRGFCFGGEVATDGCAIGGVCYPAGATRPSDPCQICDPAANQTGWSLQADDTACDTACRAGGACFSGQCAGGTVAPGFCAIAGVCRRAGEHDPAVGPCRVCDPAGDPERWTELADGTSCPNFCVDNATCQAGACVGAEMMTCAQPPDREFCQRAVCDPETGVCIVKRVPNGRGDTKGCEHCPLCSFGECIGGGPQPVDCGPCGECDLDTGTCAPAPEFADCGSDCTTRRQCNSAGICVEEPGGCFNISCAATVCDPETQQCVETGALDGQSCDPNNPCRVCQGGVCGTKPCGACQSCDPASGQCVACEHCCRGVCGFMECGDPNTCCGGRNACCRFANGEIDWCLNKNRVCEGTCFRDPVTCCGRRNDGSIRTCDVGMTCCPPSSGVDCCPPDHTCCHIGCCPPGQHCGSFGCQPG